MNYVKAFNCQPIKSKRTDWKDYWDLVYANDDEICLKSKETYEYNYSDKFGYFKYNLVLMLMYSEQIDEELIFSNLLLIPTKDYIYKKTLKKVAKSYDIPIDEIGIRDLFTECIFPILDNEILDVNIIKTFSENDEEISKYLLSASIVAECKNAMLGFDMDKFYNKLGSTNWDMLFAVLNGTDPFAPAFERLKGGDK